MVASSSLAELLPLAQSLISSLPPLSPLLLFISLVSKSSRSSHFVHLLLLFLPGVYTYIILRSTHKTCIKSADGHHRPPLRIHSIKAKQSKASPALPLMRWTDYLNDHTHSLADFSAVCQHQASSVTACFWLLFSHPLLDNLASHEPALGCWTNNLA